MRNSNTKTKPAKPYRDFPLFAHPSGQWAKKIAAKTFYFGRWADPDAALARYNAEHESIRRHRGRPRTTPIPSGGATVELVCNAFLTVKEDLIDSGDYSRSHWIDCRRVAVRMIEEFGRHRPLASLTPADFEAFRSRYAKTLGANALAKLVQVTCTFMRWAYESGMVDSPIRTGPDFKRPSAKARRRVRNSAGPRLFSPSEIRSMLDIASPQLRAMILLGINCGFGAADCSNLPIDKLDLIGGWHHFPRPKTEVLRHCPLWPETATALKEVLATRKEPRSEADRQIVFLTHHRQRWLRIVESPPRDPEKSPAKRYSRIDSVGMMFGFLQTECGCRRPGMKFYGLRSTHRTVADEVKDQVAANFIMGHAASAGDMASIYRQSISDVRLKAVTDHIRSWLFDSP